MFRFLVKTITPFRESVYPRFLKKVFNWIENWREILLKNWECCERKRAALLKNRNKFHLQDRKWRHKYMHILFFDCRGLVHYELVTRGPLLNQEFYIALYGFYEKQCKRNGRKFGGNTTGLFITTTLPPSRFCPSRIYLRKPNLHLLHSHSAALISPKFFYLQHWI